MKTKLLILGLVAIPALAWAANYVVFFNPTSAPITNRVTGFRATVNDLEYQGRPDALLTSSIPAIDLTQAKVLDGAIMLMTQTDIDTIALTNWINGSNATAQAEVNYRQRARDIIQDSQDEQDMVLRAALLVIMDEINILRAQHSLAARTAVQLRNAIQTKVDDKSADTIE